MACQGVRVDTKDRDGSFRGFRVPSSSQRRLQALEFPVNFRVHDLHLKNVTSANPQGRTIELPRGAIDIGALVFALRKVGYSGVCSLEYEKDMDNPLVGIAESEDYFGGVLDATV